MTICRQSMGYACSFITRYYECTFTGSTGCQFIEKPIKVFCSECKYITNVKQTIMNAKCTNRTLIEYAEFEDNWFDRGVNIKQPSELNKDNNCKGFESND